MALGLPCPQNETVPRKTFIGQLIKPCCQCLYKRMQFMLMHCVVHLVHAGTSGIGVVKQDCCSVYSLGHRMIVTVKRTKFHKKLHAVATFLYYKTIKFSIF